jgi:hypothetical protein
VSDDLKFVNAWLVGHICHEFAYLQLKNDGTL